MCVSDLIPEFDGVEKTSPNCVVIGDAADRFSYQNLNEAFRVLIGLEKPILFSLGQGWDTWCPCLLYVLLSDHVIWSLSRRYYKETDGLKLDVGVFMKALEVNRSCVCFLSFVLWWWSDRGPESDASDDCLFRSVRLWRSGRGGGKTIFRILPECSERHGPPAAWGDTRWITSTHSHVCFWCSCVNLSQVVMVGDDLVNDVGGAQRCGMKGVQVRTGKYRSVCFYSSAAASCVLWNQVQNEFLSGTDVIWPQGCAAVQHYIKLSNDIISQSSSSNQIIVVQCQSRPFLCLMRKVCWSDNQICFCVWGAVVLIWEQFSNPACVSESTADLKSEFTAVCRKSLSV